MGIENNKDIENNQEQNIEKNETKPENQEQFNDKINNIEKDLKPSTSKEPKENIESQKEQEGSKKNEGKQDGGDGKIEKNEVQEEKPQTMEEKLDKIENSLQPKENISNDKDIKEESKDTESSKEENNKQEVNNEENNKQEANKENVENESVVDTDEGKDINKSLETFEQSKWDNMDMDERKEAISDLGDSIAKDLNLQEQPNIDYYNNADEGDYGGYSPSENTIYINEHNMGNPAETVDTIAHESKHCQQYERAENPQNEQDVEFKENLENYIRPENDYEGYKNQPVEVDAREYASEVVDNIPQNNEDSEIQENTSENQGQASDLKDSNQTENDRLDNSSDLNSKSIEALSPEDRQLCSKFSQSNWDAPTENHNPETNKELLELKNKTVADYNTKGNGSEVLPKAEYNKDEISQLKATRDAEPAPDENTVMQKVLGTDSAMEGGYLDKYFSPPSDGEGLVTGFTAKAEDAGPYSKDYDTMREANRLDYCDGKYYPENPEGYFVMRYTADLDDSNCTVPYGENFGGTRTDSQPFTGNGYTGSENAIIPEYTLNANGVQPNEAVIYHVDNEGNEKPYAKYDNDEHCFVKF